MYQLDKQRDGYFFGDFDPILSSNEYQHNFYLSLEGSDNLTKIDWLYIEETELVMLCCFIFKGIMLT